MNMTKIEKFFLCVLVCLASSLIISCVSLPKRQRISRNLLGQPVKTAEQLSAFFINHNPSCDREMVKRLASLYVEEALAEGINSDCAFAQMCLETGYLTFGNLVVPEMHNYCGLGAMDKEHPGEWFSTEELGVRAHIQHLQAYATTEDVSLNKELVDPRYGWVHKTKFAVTIYDLAGVWATDKLYGDKIDAILNKMERY